MLGLTANDLRLFDVPEVLEVQVIASGEVSRVPEAPTATNTPLELELEVVEDELSELLLDESLFFAQEMTVKLKRNMKKIMGIYLTWFTISG